MSVRPRLRVGVILGMVVAVIVLAAASTIALAAARGAFRSSDAAPNGACSAPALAGTVVDVRLMNMGGRMMSGGGMMGGTMRVVTDRAQVPAGTVSFRVANVGSLVHELVVLPLKPGSGVGQRTVGSDGRVNEEGSLGEASQSCGAGAGDGIAPGALGWVSIDRPAGDYELICNLPGHYASGM